MYSQKPAQRITQTCFAFLTKPTQKPEDCMSIDDSRVHSLTFLGMEDIS